MNQVHHAKHLAAVAHHLPVASLPPPEYAVPVDHERGTIGHVAVEVEHAVGGDHGTVHVAQERERERVGLEESGVAEGAVPADREEDRAAAGELGCGLSQAGELGRSDAAEVIAVEAEDDVASPELPQR
jgi:hypothetical protein